LENFGGEKQLIMMRWKSISAKLPRALRESVSEFSTATAFNSATTRSINSSKDYIITAKWQRLPSERRFLEENLEPGAIDLLACATTLPDLLVSGFVSTVQGELSELFPLEIVSTQGVCCAGVSDLNYAPSQLEPCQKQTAIAVAAEFPSRLFKNTQFEAKTSV
jgi:hypothetical protein